MSSLEDDKSIIEEIIYALSNKINEDEYFQDIDFYYDLSQINQKDNMPCVVFNEIYQDFERITHVNDCDIPVSSTIEIMLCTDELYPAKAISEGWKFREHVVRQLASIEYTGDIHPKLNNIIYLKHTGLESLYWKESTSWKSYDDDDKARWICNAISVIYELRYEL